MSEELAVLALVVSRLEELGIIYMLTGSLALSSYAVPRMTRDIDIVVEMRESEADDFCLSFEGDFYLDREAVREALTRKGTFNLINLPLAKKIDFMAFDGSPFVRRELERSRRVSLEGMEVSLISPEDLLLFKLLWAKKGGSELRIADARDLIECRPELDRLYLEEQADRLGVGDMLREVGL